MKKIAIVLLFVLNLYSSEPIVIGLHPFTSQDKLEQLHEPLREYLEKKLGKKVILRTSLNYHHQVELLKEEKIDIAAMSPNIYRESRQNGDNFEYLFTATKYDKNGNLRAGYKGVIISLKGSNIYTFSDLKGKKFGFTDIGSTSGYACPRMAMRKNGINPDKDLAYSFKLKKHSKVVNALLRNSIDAGATYNGIYDDYVLLHGEVLHIIYETPLIPYEPFVVNKNIDKVLKEKIYKALLEYKDPNAKGEMPAAFKVLNPSLYDIICKE